MDNSGGNLPDSSAAAQQISVCVIARHTIVLSELLRVLKSESFQIIPIKLEFAPAQNEPIELPIVSVYIIDSAGVPSIPVEVIRQIMSQPAKAQVIVLAEAFDESSAFPLLNLGVKGLISHEFIDQQLARALHAVAAGGFWVPRALLSKFVDSVITKDREPKALKTQKVDVSRREREIIEGLLMNLSNKEIASRLNISERTVKFHVSNLLVKFNVQRRADLILLCYQNGHKLAEYSTLPTPQISWRIH
jgi:DNA-binding NarL/FixJ family response regulator